jgi:hemolysin activation/secretion protein
MGLMSNTIRRAAAGLLMLGAAATAAADALTPGGVGATLKPAPQLHKPPPAPAVRRPPPPPPLAVPEGGPRIVVRRFVFSGNSIYPTAQLQALLQDELHRPLSLAQLYAAADRIADFYAAHGYVLATVVVPPQSVDQGDVRLQVVEGRIGRIRFENNDDYGDALLTGFMRHTHPDAVYRSDALEQDLYVLNSLPGLKARAVLTPAANFGHSDVVVKTAEKHFGVDAGFDNYGRREVGEYRYSVGLTLNNPGRIGDQLKLLVLHSNTDRLNYGSVAYNLPIGYAGWRLDVDLGRALFKVAPPLEAAGKNESAQVQLERPWLHTARDALASSAGYLYTDANADLAGVMLSDTRISLLTLGMTGSHLWDDGAASQWIASVHTNFHQANAVERNRERIRGEINLQHLQPVFGSLQALAVLDGVWSPDPLPDTEQLSIGGPTTIRGFAPAEVRGDRGWYGQLTLRLPRFVGPLLVIPRVYGDTGVVGILDHPPGAKGRDSLSAAGIGTDINYRQYSLHFDWAYPLDSRPGSDGRDDGRVYISLTAAM